MNKYHELAERARLAAGNRRRSDAELSELVGSDLLSPAEMNGGKVAENGNTTNHTNTHEIKVFDEPSGSGCLVDTHPTPSTPPVSPHTTHIEESPTSHWRELLSNSEIQKRIKAAKAQRKRQETRAATMQKRAAIPTVNWKRAKIDDKFRYASHAAERADGVAFSLNLSEKTQGRFLVHRDPIRAFTDTLNRKLGDEGLTGTPYALALEYSDKGKLHVHGFLVPPSGAEDALRRALKAAGSKITGKASGTQLRVEPMSGGAGWAFYCRKDQERTEEVLAGRARPFLNRAMIGMAREFSLIAI